MVYIVLTAWYPLGSEAKIAEKYVDNAKKFPTDKSLGKRIMLAMKPSEKGTKTLIVWEVKDGKFKDYFLRIGKIMLTYGDIPGYKYKIDTYMTEIESFGLGDYGKPPER